MSRIGRIARKTDKDLIESIEKLEDVRKRIVLLFEYVKDDLRQIAKKARGENAAVLISDLRKLLRDLEELKKVTHNVKITNDIDALIQRLRGFIDEFARIFKTSRFKNSKEKINYLVGMINKLVTKTLYDDLNYERSFVASACKELRRVA